MEGGKNISTLYPDEHGHQVSRNYQPELSLIHMLLASCTLWPPLCQCMIPDAVLEKQEDCAVRKPNVHC